MILLYLFFFLSRRLSTVRANNSPATKPGTGKPDPDPPLRSSQTHIGFVRRGEEDLRSQNFDLIAPGGKLKLSWSYRMAYVYIYI